MQGGPMQTKGIENLETDSGYEAEELVFPVTSHGSKTKSSVRQFSSAAYTLRAQMRQSDGGKPSSWGWIQLSNTCRSVLSTPAQ